MGAPNDTFSVGWAKIPMLSGGLIRLSVLARARKLRK